MAQSLQNILAELGMSQYLGAFLDQGFDTWDTVLDITEKDLEALGVKLGHRRKLQRQIGLTRGVSPTAALQASNPSETQESKLDPGQSPASRDEGPGEVAVTKRKYRRHPKPDKNAPERPPSAYVLFSNSIREELKGQAFTFTEIAKIVGEKWQHISQEKREQFESRARYSKDKYRRELAEHKKTPEYRQYAEYLQDFKKQQQARGKSASRGSISGAGRSYRRGSTSSSVDGSNRISRHCPYERAEPSSPERHQRMRSERTPSESQARSTHPSEASTPPRASSIDIAFGDKPISAQNGRHGHQKLPSLSDVFDARIAGGRFSVSPTECTVFGHYALSARPGIAHKQTSPSESPVSSNSGTNNGVSGPAGDASLPIHSLLSNNVSQPGYETEPWPKRHPLVAYGGL